MPSGMTVAEQAEVVKALKAGGKGNKDPEVLAAVKVLKELKAAAAPAPSAKAEAKGNQEARVEAMGEQRAGASQPASQCARQQPPAAAAAAAARAPPARAPRCASGALTSTTVLPQSRRLSPRPRPTQPRTGCAPTL